MSEYIEFNEIDKMGEVLSDLYFNYVKLVKGKQRLDIDSFRVQVVGEIDYARYIAREIERRSAERAF